MVPAGSVDNRNWIGIYRSGDSPGQVSSQTWQYVAGESGQAGLSTASLVPGNYTASLFYQDGYGVLAGPVSFSVTP